MEIIKSFAVATALFAANAYANAQDVVEAQDNAKAQDKVEPTVGIDIVANYIWRGQHSGDAAFQPTGRISWQGLSLSAWGSLGFVNTKDSKELDFTLSYSIGGLTIGITDYWIGQWSDKFFSYRDGDCHTFEANVGYDFGPVSVNWFTNFAGTVGRNPTTGKKAYASYFEVAAPFKLGGLDWKASVGCVPYKTDFYDGAQGGVGGFACTNITLNVAKALTITPSFSLPVFAAVTANPHANKVYFTAGVSF